MNELKRLLERIEIPGEHDARLRSWELVRSAHSEREPVPRPRRRARAVLALAAGAALVAAALTPPGRAVIDEVREAIGVDRAAPALFSLPADGRLLVVSAAGPWVVGEDGSKRLLGDYREASWSPFGRFVVAARTNELVALEPDGDVRWKLARRDVHQPRWGGTGGDTRIAYRSRGALRVVAGDGSGDRAACAARMAPVAPAWRPRDPRHVLALVAPDGAVRLYAVDRCQLWWRSDPVPGIRQLVWSLDGERLAAVTDRAVVVFAWNRRRPLDVRTVGGVVDAAWGPGRRLALARSTGGRSEVLVGGRRAFLGTGRFTGVEWSPDGRWLLVAWREADQWVFVRSSGPRRLEAVSGISGQFESSGSPSLAGWCCPPE